MSTVPVFADALSRLHADIALIRLIQAGIPASRISAVFPRLRAPNGVCCWLKDFNRIPGPARWPIAAAGVLGRLFRHGTRSMQVAQQLEELGLGPELANRLKERIDDGSIVVCVHARTETEAAIAWHVFQHVGAENITVPAGEIAIGPRELPLAIPHAAQIAA